MKLLIVDDEELTRTGVISSIDWQSIGIREVLQADDGINGIEVARVHRPDIVLCDVRMPRLDGIAMLEQLEEILPDIVPVFMSGYSDKEYLKAAIKLKAVNHTRKASEPCEVGMPSWKPCDALPRKKNAPAKCVHHYP
ncbi:MAG: response regulator [Ruminococcus sp.]